MSSDRARGAANLILGLAANSTTYGEQAARAAFDNFHATAASVDCSGYPLPHRKPVRSS